MHNDNPAGKTTVAKVADDGGPLPWGRPAQAARRFACLRFSVVSESFRHVFPQSSCCR